MSVVLLVLSNPMKALKFYLDIVDPRIKAGGKLGEMEVDKISRQLQVEIRMSSAQFLNTANWMQRSIKELQKKGILKVGKKPRKGAETYRV